MSHAEATVRINGVFASGLIHHVDGAVAGCTLDDDMHGCAVS